MEILKRLGLVFAILAVTALATPAHAEPVRIVLLTPATETALPGQLLSTPFMVRVERATGEPLPGVQLWYSVDLGDCPAGPCPVVGDGEFGFFETEFPNTQTVLVTTGSDGTATAPPFRAGHPTPAHLPWVFTVSPYAGSQTTPAGFTITSADASHPIGGYFAAATTVRIVGSGAPAIPALHGGALLILGALLAAAGLWTMRSLGGAQ